MKHADAFHQRPVDVGLARRTAIVVCAGVVLVLQVLSGALSSGVVGNWVWTVLSCVALALVGWFPAVGGAIFAIIIFTGILLPPEIVVVSVPFIGIYVVAADWISRRWYIAAAIMLVALEGAEIFQSDAPTGDFLGLILGVGFAILAGAGLRWNHVRVEALEEQRQRAASEAETSVRHKLAATLHDTVASDLVRVIVASQSIAQHTQEPDTAAELEALGDTAREAMWHLRVLMDEAGVTRNDPQDPLAEVLGKCRTMLAGRHITVNADVADGVDVACTSGQRSVLALALREGATNVLKYAPSGSTVNLTVETLPGGGISLAMANDVDPAACDADGALSGGFGLVSLAERAAREGGTARYGCAGGTWLLTVELPGRPMVQEPTGRETSEAEGGVVAHGPAEVAAGR